MRKESFANTLAELGDYPKVMNECERYGIVSGCDEHCPVLQRNECHIEILEIGETRSFETMGELQTWIEDNNIVQENYEVVDLFKVKRIK